MLMAIVCLAVFGLFTVIMVVETRRLWNLSATEVADLFGPRWRSRVSRRMRIATPAGLLLCAGFLPLSISLVLDEAGLQLPSSLFLGALIFLGLTGLLCATATQWGVPRQLLLPAFRPKAVSNREE